MIDTRLMVTSRSAPATSTPTPNAPLTTAKSPKRNSATANEPIVKAKRIFLRKRLANISPRNFMLHLRPQRPGAAPVQAFPFRGAELYPRAAPRLDRESPSARFFRTPLPGVE